MKFRLLEDLESDLQQEAAEKDALRKEVANIFRGTDFKEKKNINGISYNASYNGIEASFYIDDAVSYNGYVYDGADYNLQVEGDMKTVVESAQNVLDEYTGLLDSADFEEEEVAEEESEEVEEESN